MKASCVGPITAGLLVCILLTLLLSGPAQAGDVVVSLVEGKHSYPSVPLPADLEAQLIKMHGEEMGRRLYADAVRLNRQLQGEQHYTVLLDNLDLVRRAERVELHLEFFDGAGRKTGDHIMVPDEPIEPNSRLNVTVRCTDEPCRVSQTLKATVKRVTFVEAVFGAADEIVFEWNDRRWYLENRWDAEKRLVLRSFSHKAYTDKGFDKRVFTKGDQKAEEGRYYRLLKEQVRAGYGQGTVVTEVEHYELLPGFVVEKGQRRDPSFFSWGDVGMSDTGVSGVIAADEFVQIKNVETQRDGFIVVIGPVCAKVSKHRSLRAKIRFVVGRSAMKEPDDEVIERTVREWLEPVSITEVAAVCGPKSGTPVMRWSTETTPEEVERMLGPAGVQSVRPDGEVLVYGTARLKFVDGRLAGLEKRARQ